MVRFVRTCVIFLPVVLTMCVSSLRELPVVASSDTGREQPQSLSVDRQKSRHIRQSAVHATQRHRNTWLGRLSNAFFGSEVKNTRMLQDVSDAPSASSIDVPDLLLQLAGSQQPIGLSRTAVTKAPTQTPTASPTDEPSTAEPTTLTPSIRPTSKEPTKGPTSILTTSPPSAAPATNEPSLKPSGNPIDRPSLEPTPGPTVRPSDMPTSEPPDVPTLKPSDKLTLKPSDRPTLKPSDRPTLPSDRPTLKPSDRPTLKPSDRPTLKPSDWPTLTPSDGPSSKPTNGPTFNQTIEPSLNPTRIPTLRPSQPLSRQPTQNPWESPTLKPSLRPTLFPSSEPTYEPTAPPTLEPSLEPTLPPTPTFEPTIKPSLGPSQEPTLEPSFEPSAEPVKDTRPCAMSKLKRQESLLKFLLDNNISSQFDLLSNQEHPDAMAFMFIFEEDQLELCADSPTLKQRFALATLYFSTKGDSWDTCNRNSPDGCDVFDNTGEFLTRKKDGNQTSNLDSSGGNRRLQDDEDENVPVKPFLSAVSECEWFGISCDVAGRVTGIDLPNNNLRGSIPSALFRCLEDDLNRLILSENKLKGVIPSEIGLATNLNFLVLFANNLQGVLPPELALLSGLRRLLLYDNDFVGTITNIGNLTELRSLRLHNNQFRGVIPTELGGATGLMVATFHNNLFNGSMPLEICENISPLGVLETLTTDCFSEYVAIDCPCCTDCFEGIPCGMSDAARYEVMMERFEKYTDLKDLADSSTPQGRALQWLAFEDEYKICQQDANLEQRYALTVLYFATAGESEAGWNECADGECTPDLITRHASSSNSSQRALFMSAENECHWDGVVCDDEGMATELVVEEKELEGEIPRELEALSQLTKLDLSKNNLSGSLTRKLKHLHKLVVLKLNKNNLNGDLPDVMDEWAKSLKTFDIGNNNMEGVIDVICNMTKLEYLELQGNRFTGEISPKFASLERLVVAKFHGNELTGTFPEGVCANFFPLGDLEDVTADCNEVLDCFCCTCYPRDEFYGG